MHCVAFSPDDRFLAAANKEGEIWLWNVSSGALVRTLTDGRPQRGWSVAFSPNGRALASAAAGGTVSLWDLTAQQHRPRALKAPSRVHGLACLSNGTLLTAGQDGAIRLLDPAAGRDRTLIAPSGMSSYLAVDAHGKRLAIAHHDSDNVRIWDLARMREDLVFPTGHRQLTDIALTPDGTTVVTAGWHVPTRFWDAATGRLQAELPREESPDAYFAFAPNGALMCSPGHGIHRVSRYPSCEVVRTWAKEGLSGSVAFDAEAKFLALASRSELYLWDLNEAAPRSPMHGHRERITALAFSPDRKTLVSASTDGVVKLWHVVTGQELMTLTGHGGVNCVAFSPEGQRLATGGVGSDGRGQVLLWDAPRASAER